MIKSGNLYMNFAGNGETKKEDLHIIHRIAPFFCLCANQTD